MATIKNYTPHPVNFITDNGTTTFHPVGLARVAQTTEEVGTIEGEIGDTFRVIRQTFGQVQGLPEQQDGVYYIVSSLVAQAAQRSDCLIPSDPVRDEQGRIIGCRAFAVV